MKKIFNDIITRNILKLICYNFTSIIFLIIFFSLNYIFLYYNIINTISDYIFLEIIILFIAILILMIFYVILLTIDECLDINSTNYFCIFDIHYGKLKTWYNEQLEKL